MTDAPSGTPIARALAALESGRSLTRDEAASAFEQVMAGRAWPADLKALLLGLKRKGETPEEVTGAALALRGAMTRLELPDAHSLVDTCGTGGGTLSTVNISTGAAFVVAGAGVRVAKHGNRSYTSRSGSADVLEAMGISLSPTPDRIPQVIAHAGLAFLFAPTYHPAMRHAAQVRKELGTATIMNLLGPLANPAGVRRQVIGVFHPGRAPLVAEVLRLLGVEHALVVHAESGMDEVSPVGLTRALEVRDGVVNEMVIDPAALRAEAASLAALAGGDPAENARRLEGVLRERVRGAVMDALLLNAAAALYVSGNAWSMEESLARARDSLESGAAWRAVERLREASAP